MTRATVKATAGWLAEHLTTASPERRASVLAATHPEVRAETVRLMERGQ